MPEARRYASVVVATARPDGVYVGWAGPALIASSRDGAILPEAPPPLLEAPPGLGGQSPPRINTQLFVLGPGESLTLAPGVTAASASAQALSATLQEPTDLEAAAHLLDASGGAAAGLVIYRPGADIDEDEAFDDPRWTAWGPQLPVPETLLASPAGGGRLSPPPRTMMDERAAATPQVLPLGEVSEYPDSSEFGARTADRAGAAQGRLSPALLFERAIDAGRDLGSRTWGRASDTGRAALDTAVRWALPTLALVLVVGLGFLVVRDTLPALGGRDRSSVEAAGRLIQEANATSDREQRLRMLSEAIAVLEPQASRNDAARALLGEARNASDGVLNLVRVGRDQVFPFPTRLAPGFKPGGLWKGERSLLVLDLGGQVLYRTNGTGTQLDAALRPGDLLQGQPLGQLVTAAWSPARGANTQGQLLLVDHVRSIISLSGDPPTARRWLPPDSGGWERIGPSAATFDDLFLVDNGRGEVWRYPARSPGAAGSLAVSTTQETRVPRAIDIATDGNIYLLFSDGGIGKFAPQAGRLPFEVAVPHRPLVAPNALFAHPDLDRLWILETTEARVVELTNQGTYLRQWVFPPDLVQHAANLHVDAAAGELRLLTPQAVLRVTID